MTEYDYDQADREGFDVLAAEGFTRFGDMIFRKSRFDPRQVTTRLREDDPETVQRHVNHTHLLLYAPDLTTQRAWAEELRSTWLDWLQREFPDLRPEVEVDDTGEEVIVTALARGQ